MSTAYDTIILGSSPNALTAAAYLARAGQRVLILERSGQVGGAYVTELVNRDCHYDITLMSGRLDPSIVADLRLEKHGLEVIERNTITSLLPGGKSFTLSRDTEEARAVIRQLSARDADRYEQFLQLLERGADLLRKAYRERPAAHPPSSSDSKHLSELIGQLKGYGRREMTEVMRILVMSARDLLDEWFESDALKGLLGSVAVRGLSQGPFAAGTTFNLLHHLAIGDAYFRATARGGVGGISVALASAAKEGDAELRTEIKNVRVVVKDGAAVGVDLDGEVINASCVISDYDARETFRNLVAPSEMSPEFNRAINHIRYNSHVFRAYVRLKEFPEFIGLPENALRGTLVLAPSLNYIERAFDQAKYGGFSSAPYMEVTIPSLSDPTLAPEGQHVMMIWFQYARNKEHCENVLEVVLSRLEEFAPKLRSVAGRSDLMTSGYFQSTYHLSEGDFYGGQMTLDQSFYLRPVPGYAQYSTPIENLFLCGSATHPGGGISGLSGRNLVHELGVKDLAAAATQ